MALTQKQIEGLRQDLEDKRQQILMQVRNGIGQGTTFHGDVGDLSTSLAGVESELDLEQVEREQLLQIEEALERMEEGAYGICQNCKKEIPYKRLKAVPFALYDAECKAQKEAEWNA